MRGVLFWSKRPNFGGLFAELWTSWTALRATTDVRENDVPRKDEAWQVHAHACGGFLRSPPESGLSCTILRWIGVSLSAQSWLESQLKIGRLATTAQRAILAKVSA